jgi:hypothetical protein
MYDLGEIIGRYVLTGIILWAALFIMLVIRLLYVAFKPGNGGMDFIDQFGPEARGEKVKMTAKDIIGYIVWPYGLISTVHEYMKREAETFERMRKLQENTKS